MDTEYERMAAAIQFLEAHAAEQPDLAAAAAHVGLSPFHFQRQFRRWAGVSPKRFLEYLTVTHAKQLLRNGASVLDAALTVGLSGPGRLHDHFIAIEAATPGDYRRGGSGLEIRHGMHVTRLGTVFVATTPRGICRLEFVGADGPAGALARLERDWPAARLRPDAVATGQTARRLFTPGGHREPLHLHIRGTNFQLAVWQALLRIRPGTAAAYGDVAAAIGRPAAGRATGAAIAANPVAYLIPCHRVLRGSGDWGGYRWGPERKRLLLAWESAHATG